MVSSTPAAMRIGPGVAGRSSIVLGIASRVFLTCRSARELRGRCTVSVGPLTEGGARSRSRLRVARLLFEDALSWVAGRGRTMVHVLVHVLHDLSGLRHGAHVEVPGPPCRRAAFYEIKNTPHVIQALARWPKQRCSAGLCRLPIPVSSESPWFSQAPSTA